MDLIFLLFRHANEVKPGRIYEADFMCIEQIHDLCAPEWKLLLIVGIVYPFSIGIRGVRHHAASSVYFREIRFRKKVPFSFFEVYNCRGMRRRHFNNREWIEIWIDLPESIMIPRALLGAT
jgi:hypothetical protein